MHIMAFSCIVWTIISVELTLAWNNINGVYHIRSTGQLIPFTIGLARLLGLFYDLLLSLNDREICQTEAVSPLVVSTW